MVDNRFPMDPYAFKEMGFTSLTDLLGATTVFDFGVGRADGKVTSRHYLASQHLWTAAHSADKCAEVEARLATAGRSFSMEHRSYAITAVLSSVAFLEALVNEVFQDAADAPMPNVADIDDILAPQHLARLKSFWVASKNGSAYGGILEKYQMALLLTDNDQFDQGAAPYQDVKYLIGLRNLLVHFRPKSSSVGDEHRVVQGLTGKFALNPLPLDAREPFFPAKCLAAGCAIWATQSAVALAEEWMKTLGIPRYYELEHDLDDDALPTNGQ